MELGIIGLGRMGGNISQRLMRAGHKTVVYDRNEAAVHGLADKGAQPSTGLADMVAKLQAPRAIWVMLPAGKITERFRGPTLHAQKICRTGHVDVEEGPAHQEVRGFCRDVLGQFGQTLCCDDTGQTTFTPTAHEVRHGTE